MSVEWLKYYRTLSEDKEAHMELLEDKKIILYPATVMDTDDVELLSLCLDIFENLVENRATHSIMLSTFGIYEALEALSIQIRYENKNLYERTRKVIDKLAGKLVKKNYLYVLYIDKLNGDTLLTLEETLLRIKGIISFLSDVEGKKLTVRICKRVDIKEVVGKIYRKTNMKCLVLGKNKYGHKEFMDILEKPTNAICLDCSENIFTPHGKDVAAQSSKKSSQEGIFRKVLNLWNDALYW